MPPEQARSGIAHHRLRPLPPWPLIAMHRTSDTRRFVPAKPAPFQPSGGIVQKVLTFPAKGGTRRVMRPTITADHRLHGFPFARQPLAGSPFCERPPRDEPLRGSSGCTGRCLNVQFHQELTELRIFRLSRKETSPFSGQPRTIPAPVPRRQRWCRPPPASNAVCPSGRFGGTRPTGHTTCRG